MKCVVWIAAAALAPALAPSLAIAAEPGPWTYKDLGTDGGHTYFVGQTKSKEMLAGLGKPGAAELAVRCDQKGLFVTFLWPDYVAADTYDEKVIDVDFKVDGDKSRRLKLRKVDQAAIALGKDGYRLLKDISKGQTLSVHLPDFHGGQDATFQIAGVGDIYARVTAQGCGAK